MVSIITDEDFEARVRSNLIGLNEDSPDYDRAYDLSYTLEAREETVESNQSKSKTYGFRDRADRALRRLRKHRKMDNIVFELDIKEDVADNDLVTEKWKCAAIEGLDEPVKDVCVDRYVENDKPALIQNYTGNHESSMILPINGIGRLVIVPKAGELTSVQEELIILYTKHCLTSSLTHARDYQENYTNSITDDLTGFYRKNFFVNEVLRKEILRTKRDKTIGPTLAMLDIDHFKNYNDTHGHLKGDKLIVELSNVARSCMRETDFGCRYGGEEFAVLFTGTDVSDGEKAARYLLDAVRGREFFGEKKSQPNGKLTISIGLANWRAHSSLDDPEDLIHKADTALYAVKYGIGIKQTRNNIIVYSDDVAENVARYLETNPKQGTFSAAK